MLILPLSGPPSTSSLVQSGFSPYIGPHCDPVLIRMKSQSACTSSSGWGVALALLVVLVQRGMVWAGCHALRLSLLPSGGCLVAQCNNS
jgi:hypothetical protein